MSGVDQAWPMSAHQLSAGMYFLLAKHRAERTSHPTFLHPKKTTARLTRPPLPSSCVCTGGAYPDVEREAAQCCGPVDEKLLQDMLRLAPLALHFAYCATPVEMQVRQCPGWRLKSDSGLRCVSVGSCGSVVLGSRTGTWCSAITRARRDSPPLPSSATSRGRSVLLSIPFSSGMRSCDHVRLGRVVKPCCLIV